jgi:hypothetical protein
MRLRAKWMLLGLLCIASFGESHAHGLRLSAETVAGGISGEARYVDNLPLQRVPVQLYRLDPLNDDAVIGWQTLTDEQGGFRFLSLPAGRYALKLSDGLGHQAEVRVELGTVAAGQVWSSSAPSRSGDLLLGLGVIFLIFGLLGLWMSRRRVRG